MWVKDVTRRILVNMAHVAQVDMAEMSNGKWGVKSWEVGERGADYLLFVGTEAECVDYLGELEEVLAEQGDRVAVALEKIAKQGEQDKRIKELQSMADAMEDAGFTWNGEEFINCYGASLAECLASR